MTERNFNILLLFSVFFFAGNFVKAEKLVLHSDSSYVGYTDIVKFRNDYFAVGTNGNIDCISKSLEKIAVVSNSKDRLNCAFSDNEIILAAGDNGTILFSSDGKKFNLVKPGTIKNINGFTSRNGLILACCNNGTILSSVDGKAWKEFQTGTKGNIISITSNESFFIAITDSGEILKSFDGATWNIKNYNEEYAGFSKYTHFKKIIATKLSIMLIGIHSDGSPAILFSALGNVWAERLPIYHDESGIDCLLKKIPRGITYDYDRDEYVIVCDEGKLLSIPSCSKCNVHKKICDKNLNALVYSDNHLMIVGEGFSTFTQDGF